MTRTGRVLVFLLCAAIVIAVLAGCSEKQGLSTEFDMGSLYSADGQRFCVGEFTVPLGADELADALKEYGLKYTEEAYNDAVTQWVVTAPASIEGYEASLMFRVRTDGASQTCDQITLCITEGDINEIYEDLVAAATGKFGKCISSANAGGEPGNEVVMQQAWSAYTGLGIVNSDESAVPKDLAYVDYLEVSSTNWEDRGERSALVITIDQSSELVLVYIPE